jgi:3-deoxy-D-manno-octulosonate 8-phosphate phosphatase (KDO 8-P phosphatase)
MIPGDVAGRIRLVVFDADGVLTDGGIYVADGVEGRSYQLRRFHVRDGMAMYLLREAGVEPVVVSGRDSPAVRERARELRIREVHQVSPYEKVPVVGRMLEERGLGWDRAACLADDLADAALLERVALPAAVADAVPEVRDRADWVGERPGGSGAAREFVEALLRGRGDWDAVVEDYLRRARDGAGDG